MANFDSVIFDFDGTIADTGEGVFEGIRYAIRMEGLEQPDDIQIRKFIGPPLIDSFQKLYPGIEDDCVTRLLIHYRAKYSVDGIYKFSLYDGMAELLQTLKDNSVKTGIASSKPEMFISHILKTCDLEKYFDAAAGTSNDESINTKEAIVRDARHRLGDDEKVLMVGDRKFDIIGAHDAGVPCAAVLFGYGNREEFEEYKADYIAKDCNDLKKIILG